MTAPFFCDVAVVGGGHAGVEAALAAARLKARVLLITMRADMIGAMSCNPAIGGIGKGHLVRELDVFDGALAVAADEAAIHYRMLNRSKGPAVRGPRIQADRRRFRGAIQGIVSHQPGLTVLEASVAGLRIGGGRIVGLDLEDGRRVAAAAVILATGTFLGGRLHFGMSGCDGGRVGEPGAHPLARQLRALGLPLARLKTGTPPRLDGRTIDWAALDRQESDPDPWTFSPMTAGRRLPQLACAVTRTTERTHRIIRDSLDRSPLYAGAIEGVGPRYCPSIEDKVVRFGDRDGHQIFLEPEGLDDPLVYPNGISTSLPTDVQERLIRSIPGLEQARIVQPGYAVEYDHIDPRALDHRLAVRTLPGLFCAGQINGTTGYEEAAAQGLVAGLNAGLAAAGRAPFLPSRRESYLGVMIDDLVLQGVTEPYRMLTSRAEFRLHLRADNAVARLGAAALAVGGMSAARVSSTERHLARREACLALARPLADDIARNAAPAWLRARCPALGDYPDVIDEIVADLAYAPYVDRQAREQERAGSDQQVRLGALIDYAEIAGLSREMVERLSKARPATLDDATRIRGITPAALSAIVAAVRRRAA